METLQTGNPPASKLRRVLGLPLLVFYGVGVTIGAGIFALAGEVVREAGDHAVWSFIAAGLVAAFTGYSYVLLAAVFPRAAGEAIFIKNALGSRAGRTAGYAIVAVAITSSAVIALAFARYFASFTGVPVMPGMIGVVLFLGLIAILGVRESVYFAAFITILETGTLLAVIAVNYDIITNAEAMLRVFTPPSGGAALTGVAGGAFLAFFAFIGFEDIENMAEETHHAERTVPLAIIFTLIISVAIYVLVAAVVAAAPDRARIVASPTPLADLFQSASGWSGVPIAAMASIAMVNGILVQIVMASRVIYGMAQEKLLPAWLGEVHEGRKTPMRASAIIVGAIIVLGVFFPLITLAELTSLVMLLVFAAVNLSLYMIGSQDGAPERLRRWRWWGIAGSAISLALIAAQIAV
jgi:APA family basic amino acid/polyamine antiporter